MLKICIMFRNLYILFVLLLSGLFSVTLAQPAARSTYPKAGEPRPLQLPAVQQFTLQNGLPVYLVEKKGLPIVQFTLSFNAGSIFDPADREGLAALTADLMDEGAGDRDGLALAEEISFQGIRLFVNAGREQLSLNLFTPNSRLPEALPLFADILLRPRFDAAEIERKRTEYLVSLVQNHDEARTIASTAFAQQVFGPTHPYARPSRGTEASLKAIQATDLRNFHREYLTPANGYLIIVGNLNRADAERQLNGLLQNWQGGMAKTLTIPEPPKRKGFQIFLIDKPGAAQSELRFGHPGVSRSTPDAFPLEVMNTILGASFTSRLNQNIREEHGYAYGAGSSFYQPRSKGYFLASSAVQTDVTGAAIGEFLKELNGIRSISEGDADKARNYLALGYPGNFESIEDMARQLAEVVYYQLPNDYLNTYVKQVLGVQRTDLERVATTYIQPDNMVLVIVGDRSKIDAEVKPYAKKGKINYLSIADVLGPVPQMGDQ